MQNHRVLYNYQMIHRAGFTFCDALWQLNDDELGYLRNACYREQISITAWVNGHQPTFQ